LKKRKVRLWRKKPTKNTQVVDLGPNNREISKQDCGIKTEEEEISKFYFKTTLKGGGENGERGGRIFSGRHLESYEKRRRYIPCGY